MGTPVHNITEILLKVVLNTISLTINTNLATMQFERVKNPPFPICPVVQSFFSVKFYIIVGTTRKNDMFPWWVIVDTWNEGFFKVIYTFKCVVSWSWSYYTFVVEFTTTCAISVYSPLKLWIRTPLMYSIHYVIKLVSNLRQVGGFLWVLRSTL
jgi:hypothetical protein